MSLKVTWNSRWLCRVGVGVACLIDEATWVPETHLVLFAGVLTERGDRCSASLTVLREGMEAYDPQKAMTSEAASAFGRVRLGLWSSPLKKRFREERVKG
jgi:hypothetical protein